MHLKVTDSINIEHMVGESNYVTQTPAVFMDIV